MSYRLDHAPTTVNIIIRCDRSCPPEATSAALQVQKVKNGHSLDVGCQVGRTGFAEKRVLELAYDFLRALERRGVLCRLCLVGLARRDFFRAAGIFAAAGKGSGAPEIDGKNVSAAMKVSEPTIKNARREIFFKLRSIREGLERDPNAECTLADCAFRREKIPCNRVPNRGRRSGSSLGEASAASRGVS